MPKEDEPHKEQVRWFESAEWRKVGVPLCSNMILALLVFILTQKAVRGEQGS